MKSSWTYEQITSATEKRINELMRRALAEKDDPAIRSLNRQWAYGAYILWSHITNGFQKPRDDQKIRSLTEFNPYE